MKRLLHGMFVVVYFGLLLALMPDTILAGTGDETAESRRGEGTSFTVALPVGRQ